MGSAGLSCICYVADASSSGFFGAPEVLPCSPRPYKASQDGQLAAGANEQMPSIKLLRTHAKMVATIISHIHIEVL